MVNVASIAITNLEFPISAKNSVIKFTLTLKGSFLQISHMF